MVLTPSTMLPLGTAAPDFTLEDICGNSFSLKRSFGGKAFLLIFLSRHCPYVQHVKQELGRLSTAYDPGHLGIVAVSSNDVARYPDDSPENLCRLSEEGGWKFPVCIDEAQEIAKAYRAACTPDFYLFDAQHRLAYRGQLDDSRPGNNVPVTGQDLRAAIDAVLSGQVPALSQKPSLGCNIKWKPGNEPEYFAG